MSKCVGCPYWDPSSDVCRMDGSCYHEVGYEDYYPHMCGEPYDSDYREIESCDYREDFRY